MAAFVLTLSPATSMYLPRPSPPRRGPYAMPDAFFLRCACLGLGAWLVLYWREMLLTMLPALRQASGDGSVRGDECSKKSPLRTRGGSMWLPRMGTEETASKTASKKIKLACNTLHSCRGRHDRITPGKGKGLIKPSGVMF